MSEAIILAIIGGIAGIISIIATIIKFFIERNDKKHDKLKSIEEKLTALEDSALKSERDSVRTQMLVMLNHYPKEISEIMTLAEHYFLDLKGDWYMTSIFNKWLETNEIARPEWFGND